MKTRLWEEDEEGGSLPPTTGFCSREARSRLSQEQSAKTIRNARSIPRQNVLMSKSYVKTHICKTNIFLHKIAGDFCEIK